MPVITYVPPDPTDLVLQGESMRQEAIGGGMHWARAPNAMVALLVGAVELAPAVLIAGEQTYPPMASDMSPTREVLRSPFAGTMIANHALIATPCGALYPLHIGNHLMDGFAESTSRWLVTGITKDSADAPLAACRVVVLEVGRIGVGQLPVVVETISDGSGNYSVEVPGNSAYQAIGYKDGSPDLGSISTDLLTVTQV